MNMVFSGKVGTGKTSAACLFADCAEVTVFGRQFSQWDGSEVKNVDFESIFVCACHVSATATKCSFNNSAKAGSARRNGARGN
jgi:hypothetical protein